MTLKVCFRGGDARERPGWYLGFPYDADVVERLKRRIPASMRAWDPAAKLWWVHAEHEETVADLFPDFARFRDQMQML